jgi:hypothetical protein
MPSLDVSIDLDRECMLRKLTDKNEMMEADTTGEMITVTCAYANQHEGSSKLAS